MIQLNTSDKQTCQYYVYHLIKNMLQTAKTKLSNSLQVNILGFRAKQYRSFIDSTKVYIQNTSNPHSSLYWTKNWIKNAFPEFIFNRELDKSNSHPLLSNKAYQSLTLDKYTWDKQYMESD